MIYTIYLLVVLSSVIELAIVRGIFFSTSVVKISYMIYTIYLLVVLSSVIVLAIVRCIGF